VAKATGFFNLTRQLGGSMGVAMLSTILDRRMAFHRSVLASHVVDGAPQTLERLSLLTQSFMSQGAAEPLAHARALAVLQGAVTRQASILSFNDTFYVTAPSILCFLPLVFLLGRPNQPAAVPAGH
jgi:DHA2 family multidrug resistance protein